MKDLTIVIRADENSIKQYLKVLDSLLLDYESELILVNNDIEKIDINYNYYLYKFREDCEKYKEFCFSIAQNKRVMIINKGMLLTKDIIYQIKQKLETSSNDNITCSLKTYISQDKLFHFTMDWVLVYTRDAKNFNCDSNLIIEDISFLDKDSDLEANIENLIEGKFFNEMVLWYENFILKTIEDKELKFYEILEKKKSKMDKKDEEIIEDLFLDKNIHNKYIEYLRLKKVLREKSEGYIEKIIEKIKNFNLEIEDLYFSWFINEMFNKKEHFIELFCLIKEDMLKVFFQYLFKNNSVFCQLFYDNIYEIESNDDIYSYCKIKKTTILNILEAYIEFMSDKSYQGEKKGELIRFFVIYIYLYWSITKDMKKDIPYSSKQNFVSEVIRTRELISQNKINEAISALKSAGTNFIEFEVPLYFYIQRLAFEYNYYPYILSICMIVKNEGKNLNRCLESLNPLLKSQIAELIVVDTGSTDNTVEIAKGYTDNVYVHPWKESFSEARNYSMLFARGKHIFILDADEEFKEVEINKLINEIKAINFSLYNAMTFKLINYTEPSLTQYAVLTQPLIFKNDGTFYYSGDIHNQPVFRFPIKNLDITILHYGYIMTEDIKEKKFKRTASILKRELEKKPADIYYRFQLSASYAMHGDDREAINQVRLYMRDIRQQGKFGEDYLLYYNNAASIFLSNGYYQESINICDEALEIKPDFIDFIFYKAFILYHEEKDEEALIYINRYLSIIDKFLNLEVANDARYYFYTLPYRDDVIKLMILINYRLEKYKDCIENIDMLNEDRYLKSCLHGIINSFIKTSNYKELAAFYKSRIEKSSEKDLKDIFSFFISYYLLKLSIKEKIKFIYAFARANTDKRVIELLNISLQTQYGIKDILDLILKYDIDSMDLKDGIDILFRIIPIYDNYVISCSSSINEIAGLKKYAQYILHRTSKLIGYKDFSAQRLICIFNKYMNLCTTLINMDKNLLENRETDFFLKALNGFNELGSKNYKKAAKILRDSASVYPQMKDIMELIIKVTILDDSGAK